MKIRLLGTGTPKPSLDRMGSSYMIQIGDDVILFDHGPGAYHRMLEAEIQPTQVTHVFFTHLHYDHCVDYPRLLLTHWDHGAGNIPELKVYGPPPLKRMTELLFSREGAFGPDLIARTENIASLDTYEARGGVLPRRWPEPEVAELRSGSVVAENDWRVTTTSVPHFQPQLICYAYRLDTAAGSVAYSGDAAPSKAMVKLAKDCDVLIHMCHAIAGTGYARKKSFSKAGSRHLDAARIAEESGAKCLVLSHISRQMDVPGIPERLVKEISQIYSGHIIWGQDLMEIPIGPPTPERLD
jgi:ribonuclease BN (tRNA processing enzyme)